MLESQVYERFWNGKKGINKIPGILQCEPIKVYSDAAVHCFRSALVTCKNITYSFCPANLDIKNSRKLLRIMVIAADCSALAPANRHWKRS